MGPRGTSSRGEELEVGASRSWSRLWAPLVVLVALLVLFSLSSHRLSGRKPLWYDENNSFRQIVQDQSIGSLVIQGAVDQASPAPLDYLLLKGLAGLRGSLSYLGMQPHQYFRVHYVLIAWIVLLFLFSRVVWISRFPAVWLFVLATATLVLSQEAVWYSSEMRFYSLWLTLSFAVLVLQEHRARLPWAWTAVVVALALTTTGAIVQLSVLLSAMTVGGLVERRTSRGEAGFDFGFLIVALGIVTGAYYVFRIPDYMRFPESFWPTWGEFFAFWKNYVPIMVVGFLLSVYHGRERNVGRFVATLAASGWIAVGPIWFFLLLTREFFFAPRQLIFYHAVIAYLVYELARVSLVEFRLRGRRRWAVVAAGVLVLAALAGPGIVRGTGFLLQQLEPNRGPAVPANFEAVAGLLPDRIPADYELTPVGKAPAAGGRSWWDEEAINETAEMNLLLFWDWLDTAYPPDRFPRDPAAKLRFRAFNAYPACAAPCGNVHVDALIRP